MPLEPTPDMTPLKPVISKTLFIKAHECLQEFWHIVHRPDLIPEPDEADRALMESGREVGELAREAYPGGVLIRPGNDDVERTLRAMADPNVPAIFEATFRTAGEVARVDVLRRVEGDVWELVEVKASSHVKEKHKLDAAFQLRMLRKAGVQVRDCFIAHPDPNFVRDATVDPRAFFREESVHTEALALQGSVETDLAYFHSILASPTPPPETGLERCKCPFHNRPVLDHPIDNLPFLSAKARGKLAEAGITEITQIPPDFEYISERQMRVRNAVVSGEPYFDHETLAVELSKVIYPVRFIDFETYQPAVPSFMGARPFQTVPFQWSLHSLYPDGNVTHREYLHQDGSDPHRAFGETLLDALGNEGTIVVYSSHEKDTLKSVAAQVPELRGEIFAAIDRQVDLLKLLRANVYYPEFRGSHGLKKVLPVLVPGLSYDDLEIRNGAHAAAAFEEMIRPTASPERRNFLRQALLAYCQRDTEALLHIFKALWVEIQKRRQMHVPVQTAAKARRSSRSR